VFALGIGIFLYIRMSLACQVYPASLNFPVWDTFFYVSKAAQLQECFWQDCPALRDLRLQFTPADADVVQNPHPDPSRDSLVRGDLPKIPQYLRKSWAHHCILHIYHPLESLAVVALANFTNTSLETAYRHFALFGMIFLAFAVAFFLVSLTDLVSAGVALACLAVTAFHYQGFRTVSPAALSLGCGLVMFACLMRAQGNPGLLFFSFNFLAMGFHKIGLVLNGLAVVYGVASRYPEPLGKSFRRFIPTIIFMVFFFILIHVVEQPALTSVSQPPPPGVSYFSKVTEQLQFITKILLRWLRKQGVLIWPSSMHRFVQQHWLTFALVQIWGLGLWLGTRKLINTWFRKAGKTLAVLLLLPVLLTLGTAVMLAVILALGFAHMAPEKRRSVWLFFGVITASLFLGCFFVQHGFLAQLSTRLLVIWQVAATAIFARGIVMAIKAEKLGDLSGSDRLAPYLPPYLFGRLSWRLLLAGFLIIGCAPRMAASYCFLKNKEIWLKSNQHLSLDREQPLLLLNNTKPNDVVLYDDEMVLAHFLTHGALQRRVVFLPTLPLPPGMTVDPARVKAMVARNPYLWLCPEYHGGYRASYPLRIPPGISLKLSLADDVRLLFLEILSPRPPFTTEEVGSRLVIEHRSGEKVHQQEALLLADKWAGCPLEPGLAGGVISLRNPDKVKSIFIGGLRLSPITPLNQQWPWEGVQRVTWLDPASKKPNWFTPGHAYLFNGEKYYLDVLNDGGTNVLWRMTWEGPGKN
jgi:hypothetical protein